ncbi:MAG: lysostaphin resistance A-like protein, partial [Kofleriaceae bacterium]
MNGTVAAPPPGAPYHRLARTSWYRWWRPLVEIGLLVVSFFVLSNLVGMLVTIASGGPAGSVVDREGGWALAAVGIVLAMLIPSAWIAARMAGRRPGTLSSVEGRLRWSWLARCLALAIGLGLAQIAIYLIATAVGAGWSEAVDGVVWPGWSRFLGLAVLIVLIIPFQAAGEEYAFRGTLLQGVGAWVRRPWLAIAVSTLVFTLAHGTGLQASLAIAVFGAIAGWLAVRTGGLEAGIGLHVANNVGIFLLEAASGGADTWFSTLNQGVTVPAAMIDVATMLVYAAIAL